MRLLVTRANAFLVIITLFVAISARALSAQTYGAVVTGVVRDGGGAPIDGVTVRFEPGSVETTTDARGRFSIDVPSGVRGTVHFEDSRYRGERQEIAVLAAGEQRRVAVVLAALFRLDAVSVVTERQRPLLNTRDAATGGAVERSELSLLPSDARNPLDLAFTIPGVTQATGFFGDAPPLSVAGGNSLYTQYNIDGLDNNEGFLGGPRVTLPLAAIERMFVQTSGYGTQWGRSANGVVDLESQAGGERWIGEWFVFGRPGMPIDASPKFAPEGVDPEGFRRLQVGGAAGGALVPGQTFGFAAAEYSNEHEDRIGSTARTDFLGTELRETWKLFGRLDHGWTPSQTTTLRLALSDVHRRGQGGGVIVPEADITTVRRGGLAALTHRSAFNGGLGSNTLSLQLGTFRWDFPPSESDLETAQVIIVAPDSVTVGAIVGSSNFIFDESEVQLQLRDVLEMHIGDRHRVQIGGDVARSSFGLTGSSTNPRGVYTVIDDGNINASGEFLSIDDVPPGVRVLRYQVDANPQRVDLSQTLVGAFIQDEWRVSPALRLTAGLRWDYDDITSRGESSPDLNNFQPRASFNWLVTPEIVLRGGAGVYTGKFPYTVYSDAVQFGPDGNAVVTFEGAAHPPPSFGKGPSTEEMQTLRDAFSPREIRRMFARGLEQPESYQFTLGFQRELGDRVSLSVDGIWIESRHLPRSWDLNPIERPLSPADTINRPPEFGDAFRPITPTDGSFRRLTTTDAGGNGRYRGLHSHLRTRVTERLALDATWVWSRAQNDTEDINFNAAVGNDFDADWADAINDRRHQLTLRGFYRPARWLRVSAIADYQTGTPINRIAYFRDLDGSGPIFGNGFVGNYDRFPGVPRNGERLPSSFQLNASAVAVVPLTGGRLELRADVFNVLNERIISGFVNGIPGGGPRTQVGWPGDPVAFTDAGPPRQVQLSIRHLLGDGG